MWPVPVSVLSAQAQPTITAIVSLASTRYDSQLLLMHSRELLNTIARTDAPAPL